MRIEIKTPLLLSVFDAANEDCYAAVISVDDIDTPYVDMIGETAKLQRRDPKLIAMVYDDWSPYWVETVLGGHAKSVEAYDKLQDQGGGWLLLDHPFQFEYDDSMRIVRSTVIADGKFIMWEAQEKHCTNVMQTAALSRKEIETIMEKAHA